MLLTPAPPAPPTLRDEGSIKGRNSWSCSLGQPGGPPGNINDLTVRGACKLLSGHLACPSALSQILGKAFGGSQLASSPYPGPQCHPGAQNHGAVYTKGAERRESRGCFSSVAALLPKTPQALHVVSAPWWGSKGLSRGLLPVSPASSLPSPSDLCSGLREPKNSQNTCCSHCPKHPVPSRHVANSQSSKPTCDGPLAGPWYQHMVKHHSRCRHFSDEINIESCRL